MLYLNGEIGAVYLGGRLHSEAYLGSVKVWSAVPAWEYPVQDGGTLRITQAYGAAQSGGALTVT